MFRNLFLGLALTAAMATGATASDYCPQPVQYKWVTEYRQVVTYETRQQVYTVVVTRYDHCGVPYAARETRYRAVQVPVTTTVAVRKLVSY